MCLDQHVSFKYPNVRKLKIFLSIHIIAMIWSEWFWGEPFIHKNVLPPKFSDQNKKLLSPAILYIEFYWYCLDSFLWLLSAGELEEAWTSVSLGIFILKEVGPGFFTWSQQHPKRANAKIQVLINSWCLIVLMPYWWSKSHAKANVRRD